MNYQPQLRAFSPLFTGLGAASTPLEQVPNEYPRNSGFLFLPCQLRRRGRHHLTLIIPPLPHGQIDRIHLVDLSQGAGLGFGNVKVRPDDRQRNEAGKHKCRFRAQVPCVRGCEFRDREGRDDGRGIRPEQRPCHSWFT